MRWRSQNIILYAFDLLHLDGKDLRQQTLADRRANLKQLIGSDGESRIQFSEEFDGDGGALFKACAERELEGIISKHSFGTLPERSQQNVVEDQMLYRDNVPGDWDRP
jgi:bifunctional non-homologous end joining protein LigD